MALALSYVVMLAVMFVRVDVFDNIYLSLNQVYMAGLMVAPMLGIMLAVMSRMYPNKTLNWVLIGVGVAVAAVFLICVRTHAGVGNTQFLRAMTSHHAGAILVCNKAAVTDERIKRLCGEIIESQEREIREMKALLRSDAGA